jgi:prepilin-type N-terminal cleavage/methylation domain-containing protein
MKKNPIDQRAFTLLELMITVILLGIVAGFGIPSYTKTLDRGRERDALFNLEIMREAVRMYIIREGGAPPALGNVGLINSTLGINIIEQEGNSYDCSAVNTYSCWGRNTAGWQLSFRLDNGGDVYCAAGSCPTL